MTGYRYAKTNLSATLPADTSYFKFQPGLRWLGLVLAIGFSGFLVLGAVTAVRDPKGFSPAFAVLYVALLGSLLALALQIVSHALDTVAVNSEGIWYLPRKREATFIRWRDVASVRALDVVQRLVITDSSGIKKIRLEYQLQNFERLRAFVLEHSAAARQHAPLNTVFHRNWVNRGFMLAGFGFGAAVAFYGARDGQPGAGLIFLGFAILSLASLVAEVASVQISNDSITIRYLGWQKTIAFEAITNIDLLDLQSRGNVVATVVIERRSGRPIKLMGFREGSVALSDALSSAWREASGRSQQPRSASSSD